MAVRLRFDQRWRMTLSLSFGYFVIGLPAMLLSGAEVPSWWPLLGLLIVVAAAFVERRYFLKPLQDSAELIAWLGSLQRTPDGGALIKQSDWERRPAQLREQ